MKGKQNNNIPLTQGDSHGILSLTTPGLVNPNPPGNANAGSITSLGIGDSFGKGVSRKFLYQQRDRAEAGLVSALAGGSPGPEPV